MLQVLDDEEFQNPGAACQLAIAADGAVAWAQSFGAADNSTRFNLLSATKPITASALWLLLGDGSLSLADRVGDYIPEFATNGKERVTVEHLLLHTSGFPTPTLDPVDGTDRALRLEAFGKWAAEFEPGSMYAYHLNSAHWLMAELIFRVTRTDYRDLIFERICRPLGLRRSLGVPEAEQSDIADLVLASGRDRDSQIGSLRNNLPSWRSAGSPATGAVMSASELALFYQELLHNSLGIWETPVLHDATRHVRCRFRDPDHGFPVNRTIGLLVAGDDGRAVLRGFGPAVSASTFGHLGGHLQFAWADPVTGVSFVHLSNLVHRSGMEMFNRARRITRLAAEACRPS